MISIATGPPKSEGATLDRPLDHLSACHRRIEQRLDTLERAIPVLWERRDEALQAIHSALTFLNGSGVLHTEDEESSLFPRLAGKLSPDQAALVSALEYDHRAAHKIYGELQAAVERIQSRTECDAVLEAEYADIVGRFCALYRRHIQQEDTQLIEMSRAVLSQEELGEISAEMKTRRGL